MGTNQTRSATHSANRTRRRTPTLHPHTIPTLTPAIHNLHCIPRNIHSTHTSHIPPKPLLRNAAPDSRYQSNLTRYHGIRHAIPLRCRWNCDQCHLIQSGIARASLPSPVASPLAESSHGSSVLYTIYRVEKVQYGYTPRGHIWEWNLFECW